MDTLRLKPRAPVEEEVENWDDDDFMIDDDLTFGNGSTTGQGNRRDSHNSFRSDRESLGGDEERLLHLPDDDEKSTLDAIAAVTNAGIPIPKNVPSSALVGGTIKRLGGKKLKKIYQEDWGDDLELPAPGQALRIKQPDSSQFPETLRQVSGGSSAAPSPVKSATASFTQDTPLWDSPPKPLGSPMNMDISPKRLAPAAEISPSKKTLIMPVDLDRFRDSEDDDDVFGDGESTIKASKLRAPMRNLSTITQSTPAKLEEGDDFEADLELPSSGKLNLSSRRDIPRTPALSSGDEFDWCEGSLGTRFGGTRRQDAFSNRSSSVSALSPSIASSITAESEDEALDGIVLPTGPLDLTERLERRKQSRSPERELDNDNKRVCPSKDSPPETPGLDKGDDLDGLEIGDGDVFGSGKNSMHRNVRLKDIRPMSPARPKTAVSITFSNKPGSSLSGSRLPRPMGHERSLTQPSLEPVSESGGPIPSRPTRRPQSRLGGHSSHSSVSSLHTPTTPSSTTSSVPPTTPRRRELNQKVSTSTLRNVAEPTTTNAQLLRLKRSLPVLRGAPQSPARPLSGRFDRPPSRDRPTSSLGPKTPVERARASPSYEGSAAQARKNSAPFLPAGASSFQSQHVSSKYSRPFRRHDSDAGPEIRPLSRTFSNSTLRSPSPRRFRPVEKAATEPWHNLNKPRRVRQFGDGSELDAFDDLPTSAQAELKFEKVPSGSGNRTNIRNKLHHNVLPGRSTPSPISPFTPAKPDYLPHFARDTAASRNAREASLANRAPHNGPLAPITSQRLGQISTRGNLHPHSHHSGTAARQKKTKRPPQLKPHLITNLNPAKDSKVINGMTYNPDTYRWEGNDNALSAFEVPASSPSSASLSHSMREKEASTPRPMLIQAMGSSKGVRRVGDMIFDPDMFTWHKVDPNTTPTMARPGDPMDIVEEEEDPFKDIPDLEDRDTEGGEGGPGQVSQMDDWLVGEEFDVGPEFVRRQREEEDRWRKKCEKWVGTVDRDNDTWRWAIRDIVTGT
ncbi:hypothetical protein PG984_006453 [Apiospora sp. TS-2023a]